MHRIFVGVALLACLFTSTLSAPCGGRIFYQTQDLSKIQWADVSTTTTGFTPSDGSSLQGSGACKGGIASFAEVVCCPTNTDIRCWNSSVSSPTFYDLSVGLPVLTYPPYSLRINLELKQLLLGSLNRVHTLTYANYWDDDSNPPFELLASTSGRAWNIINISGVPFYNLLYNEDSQVIRSRSLAAGGDTGKPVLTGASVASLSNIGTECFGTLSTTGTLFRWIEDGSTTSVPSLSLPAGSATYAGYNLTAAYSVNACPYVILYSGSGTVTFVQSATVTPTTIDGSLDASVSFLAFATSPDTSPVIPPPIPTIFPEPPVAAPIAVPVEAPVEVPITVPEPVVVPPPKNCTTPPPQPSSSFNCTNGTWVSISPIVAPTVVVSGSVVILSNLTVNDILLVGLNSNISISGCVSINGSLTLQLTAEDLKSLKNSTVTLLNYSGCSSSTNLSAVPLNVIAPTKGCDKVSISSTGDSPTTLVAIVTFSQDPCKSGRNKPLIIGVSAAAGAVALGALAIALAATLSTSCREKIRPFSRRREY